MRFLLFEPRCDEALNGRRVSIMLYRLDLLALLGWLLIAIGGAATGELGKGLLFFAVGSLAAVAAAAVGGAFGLLFGLPNARLVAVLPANREADWYDDSSAMEHIVDWLTKIIVGLTLTQWWAISDHFDRLAAATSVGMGFAAAGTRVSDGAKVVGGAILLGYAVLGFIALYLWARRFLKREFAEGRADARKPQDAWLAGYGERSRAGNLKQSGNADDAHRIERVEATRLAAQDAVEKARARDLEVHPEAVFLPSVMPGYEADDPWFGQFGSNINGSAILELLRPVTALPNNPKVFAVYLILRGTSGDARNRLAGKSAWLYLHPDFPDPVRKLTFDAQGEIRLPLECWGSFAVGAELETGGLLELKLSKLKDAPSLFLAS